jgi:hypothetical protein
MSGPLDLLIVVCITGIALCFAFLSLAPRPWRARLLQILAAAAQALSLRAIAQRLQRAADRHLQAAGCGACGDCGAAGAPRGAKPTDIRVPLDTLKRRR